MKIVFLKILAAALCAVALLAFVSCGGTVGSGSSESDRPQNGSGYPKDNEDEASGALKVISYNVLVEWCSEYNGENTGITKKYDYSRIDRLVALIKELQPDSFGTQECSLSIKNDILAGLDNYGCVGTMDTGRAGRSRRIRYVYFLS